MSWESVADDIDRTIRRTLLVAGLTIVGLLVAAYDIGKHRHRVR